MESSFLTLETLDIRVKEHSRRITESEKDRGDLWKKASDLSTELTEVRTEVTGIKGDVQETKDKFKDVNISIDGLRSLIVKWLMLLTIAVLGAAVTIALAVGGHG